MTAISNVNGVFAPLSDSNSVGRSSVHKNPMSLAQLTKTVGILALTLSGGGQTVNARNLFNNVRGLKEGEYRPKPYDYVSTCESGVVETYLEGLNYEDCMVQEEAAIQTIQQNLPLDETKKCYTIAGYTSVGFLGGSVLSTIGCTSAGLSAALASVSLGVVSVVATSICGIWHGNIKARLSDSRDVAVKCCQFFPKQADVDTKRLEGTNSSGNVSVTEPPMALTAPVTPVNGSHATSPTANSSSSG